MRNELVSGSNFHIGGFLFTESVVPSTPLVTVELAQTINLKLNQKTNHVIRIYLDQQNAPHQDICPDN